jgi:TonB family protein
MALQRPPSPVASLLAKAVPTVVPRIPFHGVAITGGKSAIVSHEADEPNQVGVDLGGDAAGPDRKKGEEDLPEGSERRQGSVEGGGGSGSDGDGSGIGRGGGAGKGAGGDWRVLLLRRIERAKRYPARARRLGMEGVTEVQFRITPDGTVEGVSVVKSSGFPLLDQESLETIKRAAPFPPIPGTIRIPISYRLRETR